MKKKKKKDSDILISFLGGSASSVTGSMQLIEIKQRDGSYGNDAVLPNMTCSFRLSYISSYLFVRGLLERVEEKYLLSTTEAINYLFSILRGNRGYANEFLIYDIADALELSHDELLNKKDMQKKALNSIRRLEM